MPLQVGLYGSFRALSCMLLSHIHFIHARVYHWIESRCMWVGIKYSRTQVSTPPFLHNTCEISYPLHPWPPYFIQPTQIECSCLPMFLIYQPEDGQWKRSKHVVVLYVINYTYLYHHIVVLDKYKNSNLIKSVSSNFLSDFFCSSCLLVCVVRVATILGFGIFFPIAFGLYFCSFRLLLNYFLLFPFHYCVYDTSFCFWPAFREDACRLHYHYFLCYHLTRSH